MDQYAATKKVNYNLEPIHATMLLNVQFTATPIEYATKMSQITF
jgi:hypothetical protein